MYDNWPETAVHYTELDVLTHLSIEVDSTQIKHYGWQSGVSLVGGLGELTCSYVGLVKA